MREYLVSHHSMLPAMLPVGIGGEKETPVRIAIPLFQQEISPRFCYAEKALVVDIEKGEIQETNEQRLGPTNVAMRLTLLSGLKVDLLLCGGFSKRYLPLAERLGVRVIWGLFGNAKDVVDAWVAEKELPFSPCARPRKGVKDDSGVRK